MARKKHPNKAIEEALCFAEAHGWLIKTPKTGSAHCWGQMLCPKNNKHCRNGLYCRQSIWSTPKSPEDHARALIRTVSKCAFLSKDND